MPHITRTLSLFLAVSGLAALLSSPAAHAETRHALVVGNAAYPDSPLINPVNDARNMAEKLEQVGFKVDLVENSTKAMLEHAIAKFGADLKDGDVALVFYSGHGLQVAGRNFLVPVDAKISSEQQVRLQTLDVDILLDQMAAVHTKVNIVILDACRNNPFAKTRGAGAGLAQISAPEGTIIAYATAPGKVASDGTGANGLYTAALLNAITEPNTQIEQTFKKVRAIVAKESSGAQTPWESSSLIGEFYFNTNTLTATTVPMQKILPIKQINQIASQVTVEPTSQKPIKQSNKPPEPPQENRWPNQELNEPPNYHDYQQPNPNQFQGQGQGQGQGGGQNRAGGYQTETPNPPPERNQGPNRNQEGHPCAQFIHQFCGEIQPGQGRIIMCLKQHAANLSPQCLDDLQTPHHNNPGPGQEPYRQQFNGPGQQGGEGYGQFRQGQGQGQHMGGGPGGQGGPPPQHNNPLQQCHNDINYLCPNVQPGEGRIVQCLQQHANNLSQECANILQNLPNHRPGPEGQVNQYRRR